jgi:hypothetical protein
VHYHIGFKYLLLHSRPRMHEKPVGLALNRGDFGVDANLNPQIFACVDQHANELGVELLERPAAAVQDPDLCAGAGGYVRELKRDVAAPDKEDAARQMVELQELRAGCQLILSWDS